MIPSHRKIPNIYVSHIKVNKNFSENSSYIWPKIKFYSKHQMNEIKYLILINFKAGITTITTLMSESLNFIYLMQNTYLMK